MARVEYCNERTNRDHTRMHNRFVQRRSRLSPILEREKIDLFLVTSEKNVSYLTGFSGDSTWLVAGTDSEGLVSDGRYTEQLRGECPDIEARIRPPSVKLHEAAINLIKGLRPRRIGIEGHVVSIELRDQFAAGLEGVELVALSAVIESELRSVKDEHEIAEIRSAIAMAVGGFDELRQFARSGLTERECAFELEAAIRRHGAERFSFPAIIAVGDRAALPHYRAGSRRIGGHPLLLIDWGADTPGGYKSDLTRTVWRGEPTSRYREVYSVVLSAQAAAIEAIKPGMTGEAADQVARDVITDAGYGERFAHSLGHGIGLDIHEQPRLAPKSTTVLQPGMVVTVEPGIYLPDWGGVRIEDDVLVTETGCQVLSDSLSRCLEDMLWPQ
jgi:Xaa-Pro aminopeptidase